MARLKNTVRLFWVGTGLLLLIILVFAARYPSDRDSIKVFYHAGTNVFELFKTLDHFRKDPDPRKFKAAVYVIRNMDLYYYREDQYSNRIIQWAVGQTDLTKDQLAEAEDSAKVEWASMRMDNRPAKLRDCAHIKSAFLITHINQAFQTWTNSPWQHHFTFEQFCDHMLPYKTNQARPSLWMQDYSEKYQWIMDSIGEEQDLQKCISLAFDATETPFRSHYLDISRHLDPAEMENVLTGDCTVHADWRGYVMRSLGIPVGNIYTPLWANKAHSHHWNIWMDSTGKWNEIKAREDESIPGKIFLQHFGKQEGSFRAIAKKAGLSDQDIPRYLMPWNISDVTGQVISTSDISIQTLVKPPPNNLFVYLATFNSQDWSLVDWAEYRDGEAFFDQIGRNALYLPVYYENRSTLHAGKLFILKEDGEIWYNSPDSSVSVDIDQFRVYPVRHYLMEEYSLKMCNATFEGANDSAFSSPDTLFQVPAGIDQYPQYDPSLKGRYIYTWWWQDVLVNSNAQYRYIRFRAPVSNPCEIGEMQVFDLTGNLLTGIHNYGYGDNPGYLTDGYPGNMIRFKNGEWAAVDLGKSYQISKIRYIPRDVDTASIQAGDTYTLFYWQGDWIPLYETVPEKKSVKVSVHPNGLYMLKNTTTNGLSRPFVYNTETEMVEWW
jgi:hypothetical protein